MKDPLFRFKRMFDAVRPRLRPSIVIVGAQKAGTSALFSMIARHPKVIAPQVKELTFFGNDEAYAQGFAHYLGQLPMKPVRGKGWITLDATPNYLYRPLAAARIKAHLPNALIVIVLRDPVKRAHSDWNMFHQFEHHPRYAAHYDPRSFREAMLAELDGASVGRYLDRGHYAPQVKRYFDLFGRDRVMVIAYPEFKQDPEQVVQRIIRAAGLDPAQLPGRLREVKANVRSYEEGLDPLIAERLRVHFMPHLRELDELLGTHLDLSEER